MSHRIFNRKKVKMIMHKIKFILVDTVVVDVAIEWNMANVVRSGTIPSTNVFVVIQTQSTTTMTPQSNVTHTNKRGSNLRKQSSHSNSIRLHSSSTSFFLIQSVSRNMQTLMRTNNMLHLVLVSLTSFAARRNNETKDRRKKKYRNKMRNVERIRF